MRTMISRIAAVMLAVPMPLAAEVAQEPPLAEKILRELVAEDEDVRKRARDEA